LNQCHDLTQASNSAPDSCSLTPLRWDRRENWKGKSEKTRE